MECSKIEQIKYIGSFECNDFCKIKFKFIHWIYKAQSLCAQNSEN